MYASVRVVTHLYVYLFVCTVIHPCVRVCTNACVCARMCICFSIGDAHAMHISCFCFRPASVFRGCTRAFQFDACKATCRPQYTYVGVVLLYNVFRCGSNSGTGISVNYVREILSTKIPRKPAVTTTPKYRYSLNQVSNPRYRTGVKLKPWFKPQLWNWPIVWVIVNATFSQSHLSLRYFLVPRHEAKLVPHPKKLYN